MILKILVLLLALSLLGCSGVQRHTDELRSVDEMLHTFKSLHRNLKDL